MEEMDELAVYPRLGCGPMIENYAIECEDISIIIYCSEYIAIQNEVLWYLITVW